ncbi:hypothetical protein [uncultured Tateyamaria sp.]|uniref:hypothetical protein n=1 Tax=uncultured Tateyamaria sp. TaxID=455651 RepID=UPI00262F4D92|nr:hypothetical protein [uncultured Tateyamaria sp.]
MGNTEISIGRVFGTDTGQITGGASVGIRFGGDDNSISLKGTAVINANPFVTRHGL